MALLHAPLVYKGRFSFFRLLSRRAIFLLTVTWPLITYSNSHVITVSCFSSL